jgi:signal transduction histidine kinase
MESAPPDFGLSGKKEMLDLFIHDLRVPLSVVRTSAEKLITKKDIYGCLTENQQRILERIVRNSRKAQTLIQDMVEVFRSESGIFRIRPFSPPSVLREALLDVLEVTSGEEIDNIATAETIEAFKDRVAEHGIIVEITGQYVHKPFHHDPEKVRQIWRNLISNGMKFHRQRLLISISGENDLRFAVEDDGPGISQEGQTKIFERFTRLENHGKEAIQGLGLGLSGVKALVDAMGGEIYVVSREGSGSRFEVRIPPLTHQE